MLIMDEKICEGIINGTENEMAQILNKGIKEDNVDYLYKLVDIHKDIKNEDYWKNKEDVMRYRSYNGGDGNESYGRRMRDSRGRYMGGNYSDGYGRRGVDARYSGEDMMSDIYESYRDYSDSSSYGHNENADKAYQFMIEKGMDFIDYLEDEAKTPRQKEMIRQFRREVGSK